MNPVCYCKYACFCQTCRVAGLTNAITIACLHCVLFSEVLDFGSSRPFITMKSRISGYEWNPAKDKNLLRNCLC